MLERDKDPKALLPAKLSRPRMHAVHPLTRIFKSIDGSKACGTVWVGAPAGSGKTTAVNSYLEHCDLPCLWYTVDDGDADIATFFSYLRTAAAIFFPQTKELPPFLTPDFWPNFSLFAKRFFEKFFGLFTRPTALVLDDYQEAGEETLLHEVVCNAISQLPGHINLYILSRSEPPAELVRHQANCRLSLLGWKDLRLKSDETRGITQTVTHLNAPEAVLADLHAKTDGWMAGLLLLLKRGEFDGVGPQLLSQHTPQEIFDYLGEESFKKLDPELQEKLPRLAFLRRITIAAANTVTQSSDAAEVLQRLQRGNAFLNSLMGDEIAYRFHPLMRRFLQLKARRVLTVEQFKQVLRQSAQIMAAEEDMEAAVRLYVDAGDIPAAAALIISGATDFARQGRFDALEKLIYTLPETVYENDPWLIYWRAACGLPYAAGAEDNPAQKDSLRALLGRALARFEEMENPTGSYLALAGILESIWVEMDDFTILDPWIAKYDELRRKWDPFSAGEVLHILTPAVFGAFMLRAPNHPDCNAWLHAYKAMAQSAPDADFIVSSTPTIAYLHIFRGELTEAMQLIGYAKLNIDETTSPFAKLVHYCAEIYSYWLAGFFRQDARILETTRAIEKQTGATFNFFKILYALGVLSTNDPESAKRLFEQIKPKLFNYGQWAMALYHTLGGWIALVEKDGRRAKYHAMAGMRHSENAGCRLTFPIDSLHCALANHACGEKDAAEYYLKKSLKQCREFQTRQIEFGCRLARAKFALEDHDEAELVRALSDAFALGSKHDYVMTFFWRFDIIAHLSAEALKRDIHPDYARKLIRFHKLMPPPASTSLENWPWPVKLRLFNAFSLQVDEKPVTFSGKAQLKPLALLKCLLAKGGRDVSVSYLQDALWPDTDGDRAALAYKAALHRLRKVLGDAEALESRAGRLSLNEKLCQTDLWVFEDLCCRAEAALAEADSDIDAGQRLRQLLDLYQGPFLSDEEAHWAIAVRRELAARFADLVTRLTAALAQQGRIDTAAALLLQALRAAPEEDSLRRLLHAYREKPKEAVR